MTLHCLHNSLKRKKAEVTPKQQSKAHKLRTISAPAAGPHDGITSGVDLQLLSREVQPVPL